MALTKAQLEALKNTLLASQQPIDASTHRAFVQNVIDEMYDAQSRGDLLAGVQTDGTTTSGDTILLIRSGEMFLVPSSLFGGSGTLAGLSDVVIIDEQEGDILSYNAVEGVWENVPTPISFSDLVHYNRDDEKGSVEKTRARDNIDAQIAGNYVTLDTVQTITAQKTFEVDTIVNGLTIGKGGGNIANNTVIGAEAGENNTIGELNSFVGANAGQTNTTGEANTFLGAGAGNNNTTGSANCFVGTNAGDGNTTGDQNVFVGVDSGGSNTTGIGNSFIGNGAGFTALTGNNNTFIGEVTGYGVTTGSGNSILGANVTGLEPGLTNNIILANGTGSVKAQNNGTNWTFQGSITAPTFIGAITGTASGNLPLTGGSLTGAISATNLSGTNTGNQTSIVGISGTIAQFNTALTDGDFATVSELTSYQLLSEKGANNGYTPLDSGGKVPLANLPSTLLKYQGVWNASTNTPTLTNPDATKVGNVYNVSVAGTQFSIAWSLGDWLIYNASGVVEKSDNSDDVVSVNGQTGAVVLNTSQIAELTNLYYTDARVTANSSVAANTAKVGITTIQADAIIDNTLKVGITTAQSNDIADNTASRHNALTIGTSNGMSLTGQVLSLAIASSTVIGALSISNQTFSGVKSAINTGSSQNNGINLTNNGTGSADSLLVTNSSSGRGINVINDAGGTGIRLSNGANGSGIFSQISGIGSGIVSDALSAGTGFLYVGTNAGANTFTVDKLGAVTAASAAFSGAVTATTATVGTNTTQLATTAFVTTAVSGTHNQNASTIQAGTFGAGDFVFQAKVTSSLVDSGLFFSAGQSVTSLVLANNGTRNITVDLGETLLVTINSRTAGLAISSSFFVANSDATIFRTPIRADPNMETNNISTGVELKNVSGSSCTFSLSVLIINKLR